MVAPHSICAEESISDFNDMTSYCATAPRARRYPQHPTVSCPQKTGKPSANCLKMLNSLTWGPSPSSDWLVRVQSLTVCPIHQPEEPPTIEDQPEFW